MTQSMLDPTSLDPKDEKMLKELRGQKSLGEGRDLPILSPEDNVRMQPIDSRN